MLFGAAIAPFFALVSTPPPPVVVTVPSQQSLLVLKPSEAKCSDGPLDLSLIENPAVQLAWSTNSENDRPVVYGFRIDENGRALGIKPDGAITAYLPTADVAPSLAASQFPAGKARLSCSVTYIPERSKIADADRSTLIEYSIFAAGRPPKEIFDRLTPEGSTCSDQRPSVLLRAYPDFKALPSAPGRRHWSMVQFDIDASGKPASISTSATSGSKALDKASIDAISKSRFSKGKKTGCLYPYWQRGPKLVAPESPGLDAYRKDDEKCPANIKWETKPALGYPDNFRRRSVEGWAIVAFDVAPWGATGNVEIVAAEPAMEFAQAGLNLVRAAKVANAGQGYSRCMEMMRFVMGADSAKYGGQLD